MMKFAHIILSALLFCGPFLNAQDISLDDLLEKREDNRISLEYKCVIDGPTRFRLSGTLLVQGDSYYAEGNGVQIYCDGKTRWTVDRKSKEVYMENAEALESLFGYKDDIIELKLSKVKYLKKSEDMSAFSFVPPKDSDWVITDLR